MDLINYRDTHQSADPWGDLAKRLGTSKAYLSQLAHGHRKPSVKLARRIEIETSGQITRCALRPDVFDPIDHERGAAA